MVFFFSKSCSFHAIFRENPIFEQICGSVPHWGQNFQMNQNPGSAPGQKLIYCVLVCRFSVLMASYKQKCQFSIYVGTERYASRFVESKKDKASAMLTVKPGMLERSTYPEWGLKCRKIWFLHRNIWNALGKFWNSHGKTWNSCSQYPQ